MGEHAYHIEQLFEMVMDRTASFIVTVDIVHEMIHLGWSFSRSTTFTKESAENADILLVVPDTDIEPHFTLSYSSSGAGIIHLYRETDSVGGAAVPLFNSNQRSSNLCETIVTSTPTVTTVGTEMNAKQIGSDGVGQTSLGGSGASRYEWILDRNTKYLVRFASTAAANVIVLTASIYEQGH